jgi:hypothetical protein
MADFQNYWVIQFIFVILSYELCNYNFGFFFITTPILHNDEIILYQFYQT